MFPSPNDWLETISSQIPALALLQAMGYTYLTPAAALAHRQNKRSKIVLETILTDQLHKLNSIEARGKTIPFSNANIQKAVQAIAQHPYDALYTTSETLYNLLTLGKSLEQTIDGDKKSHQLNYIDWQNPNNNVYHITDEFEIERLNSTQTRRPDIVLFVNGIPLVVIECKRPDLKDAIDQAIHQHLGNHRSDEIPHFFCLTQILISLSQNAAKYATTATDKEFWAIWKEESNPTFETELHTLINLSPPQANTEKLLSARSPEQQNAIKNLWASGERKVSQQDRALYSLLQPDRLLELIFGYIIFDAGTKKIARYQQYFAVQATLQNVKTIRGDASRQGGVIWHTTGSGKSLTMVMLAKALALEKSILNPKIILVNDRIDLDNQLKNTFKNCGAAVIQAQSGKHLLQLVNNPKAEIITTIIDKFETVAREKAQNPSADIFVLVDESHRSQYGQTHAKMRNVFPNACYIGFTGTPLLKKDKSTAQKFGGFIHSYTMNTAVADQAVVPILYEGRESEFKNTEAVDKWFDRITADLTPDQKADLKRKFKSAEPLYESEARMAEVAYDISEHFAKHFKGTSLKGQFATSSKRTAITYRKLINDWGKVRAEVVISPPDTREDNESVDESNRSEVQSFWKDMIARYGNQYQEKIIEQFKTDDEDSPDILIVVDKLLTGFDVPRNAVLYIDKRLKEHNILQAIARVNRIFNGKDYGLVIDYRGIFGEMNDALEIYAALEREGFDPDDIVGALLDIQAEIAKLPTHHANLWDVFKGVTNLQDTESLQQWLHPQDRRDDFYESLRNFAKTLKLALSNAPFQSTTPETTQQRYTKDLKYFLKLRDAVKLRYNETINYASYADQIKSMVVREIGSSEFITIIEPINIFDVERSDAEIDQFVGTAAKADAIAARIKKVATEKMEEDPVLYLRLSQLIQAAIDAHRAKRLSDQDYLKEMLAHLDTARTHGTEAVPIALRNRQQAQAFYRTLQENLTETLNNPELLITLATGIEDIITQNKVRDWQHNQDIQNRMLNAIDDLTHDLQKAHEVKLLGEDLDTVMTKIINIAKTYEVN